MTDKQNKVDSPLSTASLTGTLVLIAIQIIEASELPDQYHSFATAIASTLITFLSFHSTKLIKHWLDIRNIKINNKRMINEVDDALKALEKEINNPSACNDTKEHARKEHKKLSIQKIDLITCKIKLLDIHSTPTSKLTPKNPVSTKPAETD